MRLSILLGAALLMGWLGSPASAQDASELVSTTGQIPRDTYKTWSLFLVCNPDWVAPEKSSDLANLYHRFKSFGAAIGSDNLAIWFWKGEMRVGDPRLAENLDIARSAEFCRALGLAPSKGPYLVVTTAYPDVAKFPAERAIFELGGLQPVDLAKLMNKLTDQLLLQNKVDAAMAAESGSTQAGGVTTPPATPMTSSLWVRLLESARQSIIGFGCKVRFKIATGLFSAELRACEGE